MAKQTIQVADKPTLDEVKALLENSGYGLEAIKNALGSGSSGAVKSVQRGIVTINENYQNCLKDSEFSNYYYIDVTINTINPAKSIILTNNSNYVESGSGKLPCGRIINDHILRVYETNASNSGTTIHFNHIWQVIEFY